MALRARCLGVILSDVIPHPLQLSAECGEPDLAQQRDDRLADGGGQGVPRAMMVAEPEAALAGASHGAKGNQHAGDRYPLINSARIVSKASHHTPAGPRANDLAGGGDQVGAE